LPNELQNHICKFLPIRPFIEEFKKAFVLLEILQASMHNFLVMIKRCKDYCSQNNKKYDKKTMMEYVKGDIVFILQFLNLNGDKFLRFQDAYIKQYGAPTIPEGWDIAQN
jgi:hypothetical protein